MCASGMKDVERFLIWWSQPTLFDSKVPKLKLQRNKHKRDFIVLCWSPSFHSHWFFDGRHKGWTLLQHFRLGSKLSLVPLCEVDLLPPHPRAYGTSFFNPLLAFLFLLRRSVSFQEAHIFPGNVMGLMDARSAIDSASETANRFPFFLAKGKRFVHCSLASAAAVVRCIHGEAVVVRGSERATSRLGCAA